MNALIANILWSIYLLLRQLPVRIVALENIVLAIYNSVMKNSGTPI